MGQKYLRMGDQKPGLACQYVSFRYLKNNKYDSQVIGNAILNGVVEKLQS